MERTAPAILLVLLACACLGGCSTPVREPNVTVTDIALTGISLTTISVSTTIAVENPNPVEISLVNLSFDLFYEAGDGLKPLGHGGRENLSLPARSTVSYDIPAEIDTLRAVRAIAVLVRDGSLPLVVKGTATVDLKIARVQIPFEKREMVP